MSINMSNVGSFMELEIERARLLLLRAEQSMEPDLIKVLLRNAQNMKREAKHLVRVDTGSAKKSIRVERRGKLYVAVRAGGYITNPKTGRKVDYAGILERNYPYMRPAFNLIHPKLTADIHHVLNSKLGTIGVKK